MDFRVRYIKALAIIFLASQPGFRSFAQDVYTPFGSKVDVMNRIEILTDADKESIRQDWSSRYPNAIYLGEATSKYNCHAYAWSMSEGGREVWMNDPTLYMTDGSYTLTSSTDLKATKIFYYGGNHSAVKSYGRYFVSKWGDLCLFKHYPDDCPYNSDHLRYYKLSMEISGDTFVPLPSLTNPETKVYTLSNVPDGATVSWSISGFGRILSGQGTNSVQVEFYGSGSSTLSAAVHCRTGLVVNVPGLSIESTTAPYITDIEMFKYSQNTGEFTLRVITNNNSGTFNWSVSGGRAEFCDLPYPDDAIFMAYPNIFTAISFYTTGTYTITVTGVNPSNMDTDTFSKDFVVTEVKGSTRAKSTAEKQSQKNK